MSETAQYRFFLDALEHRLLLSTFAAPPFAALMPSGALAYHATIMDASSLAEVDSITLSVDAGQTLTLAASPAATLDLSMQLRDPLGAVIAFAPSQAQGVDEVIQTAPLLTAGTYTVEVMGVAGAGDYRLRLLLNAAAELESQGHGANDALASAQNLDGTFLSIGAAGATRAVVVGEGTFGSRLVFADGFSSATFDASKWPIVRGAVIDAVGLAEPTEPNSLRLNGNTMDFVESARINLSGTPSAQVSYYFQRRGGGSSPETGDDLVLSYFNSSGALVELDRQLGSGADMTTYQRRAVALPADALHENFRFRFSATGTNDDWFVDEVAVDVLVPVSASSVDWYSFSTAAGVPATLAVTGDAQIALFTATGDLIARGLPGSAPLSQAIRDFTDAAGGVFYVHVESVNPYELVVTRGATVDLEPNDAIGPRAQDIHATGVVLGHASSGIASAGSTGPSSNSTYPVNLTDGFGFLWNVSSVGGISTGSSGAFDGGFTLSGFPVVSTAKTEEAGREIVTGPVTLGNVQVTRKVFVPLDQGYARFLEIVTNNTASPQTAVVSLSTNLGSDSATVQVGESTGNGVFDAADDWVVTDDVSGDPAILHVIASPNGMRPASASRTSNDRINYSYDLTLAPGETQIVMHFAAQQTTQSAALTKATQLVNLELGATRGLTATEAAQIVNFTVADGDYYTVVANAGDVLTINTHTPAGGPLQFANLLNPGIELFDPTGAQVAHTNVAGNESFVRTAALSGRYSVRVFGESGTAGEYVLEIDGYTGAAPPFVVSATNPASGIKVAAGLTQITVDFSDTLRLDSVAASDLTIDGAAATAVTALDTDTLVFSIAPVGGGSHAVALAGSSVTNLRGDALPLYSGTFVVDVEGPRIVDASFVEGAVVLAGDLVYWVKFDETLDATGLDAGDVSLVGQRTGSHAVASFSYVANSDIAIIEFAGLSEDDYTLTLSSGAGGFRDLFGVPLDGSPSVHPSGDGVPGGDFTVHFSTDLVTAPFPTPLETVQPTGSLVYETSVSGTITIADGDSYTINLDANQTITLVARSGAQLRSTVWLFDPLMEAVDGVGAAEPGLDAVLQTYRVITAGVYTVRIVGDVPLSATGSARDYELQLTLNAAVEDESHDGLGNNTAAAAQKLDDSFLSLSPLERGAVLGRINGDEADWYSFTLPFGTSASLELTGPAAASAGLQLFRQNGTALVASGVGSGNDSRVIRHYLDQTPGEPERYHVRITGAPGLDYSLVVTRAGDLETDPNNTFATAATLASSEMSVLGHVSGGAESDWYRFDVAAGSNLALHALVPASGNGAFVNGLAPLLELYDPTGVLVASTVPLTPHILLTGRSGGDNDGFLERYDGDGVLDPTFANGGVAHAVRFHAFTFQADGKIIAVGSEEDPPVGENVPFGVVRFHADGTPDLTFGGTGTVLTDIGTGSDRARAVAVQPDGRIVVAGVGGSGPDFSYSLARYNPDGSLDPTFGTGGKLRFNPGGSYDGIEDLRILPDGKILIAGNIYGTATPTLGIMRLHPNGAIDLSFGTDGRVTVDFDDDMVLEMGLQSDGKIVLGGVYRSGNFDSKFSLVRLSADGIQDPTFGAGGRVTHDLPSRYDSGQGMVIQPDGKIILAGQSSLTGTPTYNFTLVRYNADGSVDTTFGTGGVVISDFGGNDIARAVALHSNGRIIVAGEGGPNDNSGYAVYDATGTLLWSDFNSPLGWSAEDILLQPRYTDVVTHTAATAGTYRVRVAGFGESHGEYVLNVNVAVDQPALTLSLAIVPQSMSESGGAATGTVTRTGPTLSDLVVTLASSNATAAAVPATVTIPAGSSSVSFPITAVNDAISEGAQPVLITASHHPPPVGLDTSFGVGGLATTTLEMHIQAPRAAMTVQPDGKVIAAAEDADTTRWRITRLLPGGGIDTGFGTGGVVTTQFLPGFPVPYRVLVQPDGKIIVGGLVVGNFSAALVRYNADGSPDASFGVNGVVDTSAIDGWIEDIALQSDGDLLLAIHLDGGSKFRAARVSAGGIVEAVYTYPLNAITTSIVALRDGRFLLAGDNAVLMSTAAGTLDFTFGVNGIRTIGFGVPHVRIAEMEIDAVGRIIVGATVSTGTNVTQNFAVARLLPGGAIDTKFGSGGFTVTDFNGVADIVTAMMLQTDGRIVLAGTTETGVGEYDAAFARYTIDGILDPTFDADGRFRKSILASPSERLFEAALFPDGKLIALHGWGNDYRVARYHANAGSPHGAATINVIDDEPVANFPPSNVVLTPAAIAENAPVGSLVGNLSVTDPDVAGHTYALVAGTGSADNASFTIVGNQVVSALVFDREIKSSYSIRVRSTDAGGLSVERPITIGVTDVDEIAPTVTRVFLDNSNWSDAYRNHMQSVGIGSSFGYAMEPDSELQTLPWHINRIAVQFSEHVDVEQADLSLLGVNTQDYAAALAGGAFSYDAASFTAAWTLAAPLSVDKLRLVLSGRPADAAGNPLNGNSTGGPGEDAFALRFNLLPGDVNGSDGVHDDAVLVRSAQFKSTSTSGYSALLDVNGDGIIRIDDLIFVRNMQSSVLPPGEPGFPESPLQAQNRNPAAPSIQSSVAPVAISAKSSPPRPILANMAALFSFWEDQRNATPPRADEPPTPSRGETTPPAWTAATRSRARHDFNSDLRVKPPLGTNRWP